MADYKRFEHVTKRVVFSVPSGSPYVEVGKAVAAARQECAQARGVEPTKLYDDDIRVKAHDEEIHVFYEIEVKPK